MSTAKVRNARITKNNTIELTVILTPPDDTFVLQCETEIRRGIGHVEARINHTKPKPYKGELTYEDHS